MNTMRDWWNGGRVLHIYNEKKNGVFTLFPFGSPKVKVEQVFVEGIYVIE